jgi:glycosyltransferase involved in cell wall biosynthesis
MSTSLPFIRLVPRVTVGVPVYNGARYLSEALDSLLAQTFEDFEIIISDNASTDETGEIATAYAARDSRVRYVRNRTNIGSTRNYNRVINLATGEYFRWAAADDLSGPHFLAECIEVLDNKPDVVMAYPRTMLIDVDGKPISPYDDGMHLPMARPADRFIRVLERIALCNAIYGVARMSVLRRTSMLRPFVGSDMVFFAEMALYGPIWEVPTHQFYRRMHPEASNSMDDEQRRLFYDPNDTNPIFMRTWRHLWENARSLESAPIGAREKARAGRYLLRSARWSRDVLASELRRAVAQRLRSRKRRPIGQVQGGRVPTAPVS